MTLDELTALLNRTLIAGPKRRETCPFTDTMILEIAKWMHVDQEGFAKSDLIHMQLECRVLIDMLNGTREALGDLAAVAEDSPEAMGFIED